MHTPLNVHYGRAHPERFVRQHPQPPTFPTTSWINEPEKEGTNSKIAYRN